MTRPLLNHPKGFERENSKDMHELIHLKFRMNNINREMDKVIDRMFKREAESCRKEDKT